MEISYRDHALLQMRERRIREEHVRFVLENGEFVGYSQDGIGERWRATLPGRTITVVVEWLSVDSALIRTVWD